ncbi:MAG: hypothetical protein QE271_04815 [Bacteriovoracaceae bacterium]|nr:hypothetical protein [Bacteriovoracaceae bacterium]
MAKLFIKPLLVCFIFATFSFRSFATNAEQVPIKDGFAKRFTIDRNPQGVLVAVRSKQIITTFSLIPFLKLLLDHIAQIPHAQKSGQTNAYQVMVNETIDQLYAAQVEDEDYSSSSKFFGDNPEQPTKEERIEQLKKSLDNLPKMEMRPLIDQLAKDPDLKEFEAKLPDILSKLRPDILAKPDEPKFYFNKMLIEKLVSFILTQAVNRLPSVPYLGLLQGILGDVQNILSEQRTYQQNILIAYLINFKSKDLGMTDDEVNKVLSSIYVSHLGLEAFNQFRNIEARWMGYGWNEYYTVARTTDNRLNNAIRIGELDESSKRIDMAFAVVSSKAGSDKRILNMVNNVHMFSSKPALAYDYQKPNRVKMFRLYLRLGQIGLDFIPIPPFIKNLVNQFADSFYRPQRLMEGSMIGYLEIFKNDEVLKQNLLGQSLHPYLK